MGRRFSGNGGGVAAAAASAPRAIAASPQVPAQSGPLYTVTPPALLSPIVFSRTDGNANLTINAATGMVSAASALAGGSSQTISGAIAGADGVTIPFSVTLTAIAAAATVPAAPAMTLTAGTGQVSIAWTDGADGGSPITGHRLYRGTAAGGTVLVGTITTASPYVDGGRSAGQVYFYRLSAVNAVGEGALSAEASATVPSAASAIVPTNWDFVAYGDSRTENALAGTLGAAGYVAGSSNLGPVGYIPLATRNRLRLARYPNYGISASNTTQGAAIPRMSATSTVTNSTPQTWFHGGDSTNKGADYAANSGAGVVVLLYGTNDQSGDLTANSRNNILAILNTLKNTQLKIVFNETPKGVKSDGTVVGAGNTPNLKDFAAWISTLDHASGHANARSDVIVVNSFDLMYDTATLMNKQGYLRDGLHFTPWGSKQLAIALHNRLTAVYGSAYTNMPGLAVLPVSNGATIAADTIGAHAPFVHTNPLLTPGTNGSIQGTAFGTAPTAATIPQGWVISGNGNYQNVSVTCDKTGTDPDGYPMWTITVSGTIPDTGFYALAMYQTTAASGQAIAVTDKLRAVARIGVGAGSQLLNYVRLRLPVLDATATKSQTAQALSGSAGGTGDRIGYLLNSSGYDAGGSSDFVLTQLIDLADPNMSTANGGPGVVAAIGAPGVYIDAQFGNYTGAVASIAATIQISRAGVYKATN